MTGEAASGGSRAEQRRQTESRILTVARSMFSRLGYERTSFRAIAAEAGVDPRLVLHYFGTKEVLFQRAARLSDDNVAGGSPDQVAELLLAALAAKLDSEQPATLAMIRSMLTHPEAADEVRGSIGRQQEQLGSTIDRDDSALRIALIGALMLGVTIGRDLLHLDGLRDATPAHIVGLLRPCVHLLTHGEPEPEPRRQGGA